MASEILAIKEQHLEEFIEILEFAIENYNVREISSDLKERIEYWIKEEKEYLNRLEE